MIQNLNHWVLNFHLSGTVNDQFNFQEDTKEKHAVMLCFYEYDLGKSKSDRALPYVDLLSPSEKEWDPKCSEAKLY